MRINFELSVARLDARRCAAYRRALALTSASAQPQRNPVEATRRRYARRAGTSVVHPDRGYGRRPDRKNIKIGLGKSVLIEFPRDVRDVMVSNPAAVDAVVLSSNRVFLLGAQDRRSQCLLLRYLGPAVRDDGDSISSERRRASKRCSTGSFPVRIIKVEMLNQSVVLTGSVKNPTDSVACRNISPSNLALAHECRIQDQRRRRRASSSAKASRPIPTLSSTC